MGLHSIFKGEVVFKVADEHTNMIALEWRLLHGPTTIYLSVNVPGDIEPFAVCLRKSLESGLTWSFSGVLVWMGMRVFVCIRVCWCVCVLDWCPFRCSFTNVVAALLGAKRGLEESLHTLGCFCFPRGIMVIVFGRVILIGYQPTWGSMGGGGCA